MKTYGGVDRFFIHILILLQQDPNHQCSQKKHVQSDENPHMILSHHEQRQFSINLWVGNSDDCLISPHIIPAQVSIRDYLNVYTNTFKWTVGRCVYQ
jgi:hypothetical protein